MSFFYLPYYYFIYTRTNSIYKVFSWFMIYFVPISIYLSLNYSVNLLEIFIYLTAVYTVYEIGYIWNDAETIKREKKPTLRLSTSELKYYYKNRWKLYPVRLVITFILLIVYHILYGEWIYLATNLFLILLTYAVYNNIRSRANLLLHLVLVSLRFSFIGYALVGEDAFIALFLAFPLLNFIERASQDRFNIPYFQKNIFANKKSGRYLYYFVLMILALLLDIESFSAYLFGYLFIYRFISLALAKKLGIKL